MAMVQYILSWFAVTIAFILADGIWLGFIAREFYKRQIGSLMRDEVWFAIAGMFYLIYTISVVVLVVVPAHKSGSIAQAMILGGLLGLCAYGTYDVTNLATLKGWPVTVAIVDVTWGMLLTAAISTVGFLVMDWSKNL